MRFPTFPPMARKVLKIASGLVKDHKLPRRGDGPFEVFAKGLAIFETVQSEFGTTEGDYSALTKEGLAPLYCESFVSFFWESKMRTLFSTTEKNLTKSVNAIDARAGESRLVFLKRDGRAEYEEQVFVPSNFAFHDLRDRMWGLYPHGLLLSTTQESWRTKPVFLDVHQIDDSLVTTAMRTRVTDLATELSSPTGPRAMLLLGPAGTGKTLTTQMIAREMRRSLLRVDATALQELSLKETDFLLQFFAPGILAVEDFDRVPEGRGSARLLLFLERIRKVVPGTLVLLSANDANKIDEAALRSERIDEVVEFGPPTPAECAELLVGMDETALRSCEGLCHANLARVARCHRAGGNVDRVLRVMRRLQTISERSKAEATPSADTPK